MRRHEARELYPTVTSRAPAPCGTYTHLRWPSSVFGFTGFHAFEWDVTPELDTAHGYFWAHQFAFRRSGNPPRGGYAGIQANGAYPGGPAKVAIFSIWDALDASGPGVARPFGGEGTGYQTLVPFPWRAGRTYRLRVEALTASTSDDTWWRATVGDVEDDERHEIGRILVPRAWQRLDNWSVVWTELFSPAITDCDQMECASAVWANFTADDRVPPTSLDSCFGEPAGCANSRITTMADGRIRHEMGRPPDEPASSG
jgi:hypothetical protein